MTQDDVIRLAIQAGFSSWDEGELQSPYVEGTDLSGMLEAFAKLVAEHEREECAKLCHDASVPIPGELQSDAQWSALCLATAIRARGSK